MAIYKSKKFKESDLAHSLLDGLKGIEIGGSYHNAFGLDTLNVDYTAEYTIFKRHEVELCGEAMPVDIVASGDNLPLEDKSVDFVISSHVIEHFFDPIAAIKEWIRVARKYVYIICPQRDALPSDIGRPLTTYWEVLDRHTGATQPPETDTHEHYSVWTAVTFLEMCEKQGWNVCNIQGIDDKVGNGFTIVLKLES